MNDGDMVAGEEQGVGWWPRPGVSPRPPLLAPVGHDRDSLRHLPTWKAPSRSLWPFCPKPPHLNHHFLRTPLRCQTLWGPERASLLAFKELPGGGSQAQTVNQVTGAFWNKQGIGGQHSRQRVAPAEAHRCDLALSVELSSSFFLVALSVLDCKCFWARNHDSYCTFKRVILM